MENNFTYATGRRKTSTARVYLTKGKGNILVNDLPLEEYFGREVAKILVKQPLVLLDMLEKFDIKMCVHPDDPPRNILGLPRIVSSEEDIEWILSYHSSKSNGLTLCSGSLGAGPHNDVVKIAKKFSDKIFFAHLRNVRKENDGSFEESAHLSGDTNMPKLIC